MNALTKPHRTTTRVNGRLSDRIRMVMFLLAGSLAVIACSSSTPTANQLADTTSPPAQSNDTFAGNASTTVASTAVPNELRKVSGLQLLAHRGVHQTFNRDGLTDQTCTATRMDPPTHEFLENTIPSMQAAFDAGATVVEIDIAPTSDGVLAVFHDWEVGCRTEGTGEVRSLTWNELSLLDAGYGYTVDGETFPFRGQGVGLIPRLEDVFEAIPEGQFLINFKSNDVTEAALLQEVVERQDARHQVWAVYGAPTAVEAYVSNTETRGFSEASVGACLAEYLTAENNDVTLDSCVNTVVLLPLDLTPALSGWPNEFVETMDRLGTDVVIVGPNVSGIDTKANFDSLPSDIDAYVWTDRVERLR